MDRNILFLNWGTKTKNPQIWGTAKEFTILFNKIMVEQAWHNFDMVNLVYEKLLM